MKNLLFVTAVLAALGLPAIVAAHFQDVQSAQVQNAQQQQPSEVAITPEEEQRGSERSREGRLLLVGGGAYGMAVLCVILFTGFSARLRDAVAKLSQRPWLLVAGYFVLFTAITAAVSLPWDVYSDYRFGHKYGLSNQNFGQWIGDWGKQFLVGLIVSLIVVELIYVALRRWTKSWWIWATAGSIPLLVLALLISPIWIAPLFNKFEPLKDARLRDEILAMAHSQGISTNDVFQVDASKQSKALNAYCAGIGSTQRIVLYDTILREMDPEEIKFVMAHEMGHYVLHHTWQLILLGTGIVLVGTLFIQYSFRRITGRFRKRLGFEDIRDVAGLPLLNLLFSICFVVIIPLVNTVSRNYEHDADVFALRLTQNNPAAVRAFIKLGKVNISETDPGPVIETIFYNHPALKNRIDFAKNFKE